MFRKLSLKPAVWHQPPLEFEWDAESGEVRGPDAAKVIAMAASAVKDGYIVGHPYPTDYDITDPLHKASEMAVLLGQEWILPDELADEYPVSDKGDDEVIGGVIVN